jgi:LEA14-like dessication related protein
MKFLLSFIVVALLMSSCTFYEPEFRGAEKFDVEKIDGKTVKFTAGATVYNENWFGVKVKPSYLDLYIDGKLMGKIHLDKKVKMKRKSETTLVAPFTAMLEGNALVEAMKLATKGDVKVRMKGKIKAGVFIFSKKVDFDETRTMNAKSFRK